MTSSHLLFISLFSVITLTGCSAGMDKNSLSKTRTQPHTKQELASAQAPESAAIKQCQQELEALHGLDPQQYKIMKYTFDNLMSGAAQYSGLRSRVPAVTQDAVDSLYRYRVGKLCVDINQVVLNALAERGEAKK